MDRALTSSRYRNITVECRAAQGDWFVEARPTSLHGAAIKIMLNEGEWEARGFTDVRVQIKGKPITSAQCISLPDSLLKFLPV